MGDTSTTYYGEHQIVSNTDIGVRIMRPFFLLRASRPGLFYYVSTGGFLPPPHSPRQARGCGFPHCYAVKRTAASDSAELVAGRQSHQKRPHDPLMTFSAIPYASKFMLPLVMALSGWRKLLFEIEVVNCHSITGCCRNPFSLSLKRFLIPPKDRRDSRRCQNSPLGPRPRHSETYPIDS